MGMTALHRLLKTPRAAAVIPFLLAGLLLPAGCVHDPHFRYQDTSGFKQRLREYAPVYPPARFIVVSDLHYYDPALGTSGAEWRAYLDNDRKLLRESGEILDAFIDAIAEVKADFVLVPGDLTKDGEKQNHQKVAEALARIKAQGKKVYVINGNHDILNAFSLRYSEEGKEHIDSVTAAEFADIYRDFGRDEAFSRDADSLSYAVEPVPGLWLLALDACRYRENSKTEEHIVGGRFQDGTLVWLEDRLEEAAAQGRAVMVMMHHGVIEHFKTQHKHFGEYVVDGWRSISALLASYKARVVFTGHFHAQDAVLRTLDADPTAFVVDVETGSLVTFPCPYRLGTIADNRLTIASRVIESIASVPEGFSERARAYTADGLNHAANKAMKKLGVPDADANTLAPQITESFLAHYRGDESLPPGREMLKEKGLSFMGGIIVGARRDLVVGLWNDLSPADNNFSLDLATGAWEKR